MIKHVYINPQTQAVLEQLGERNLEDVAAQTVESIRESASQLFERLGPPAREVYSDE